MIENECKTSIECLTVISIKNIFYDKMDLRLFYFDEANCQITDIFKKTDKLSVPLSYTSMFSLNYKFVIRLYCSFKSWRLSHQKKSLIICSQHFRTTSLLPSFFVTWDIVPIRFFFMMFFFCNILFVSILVISACFSVNSKRLML